MTRKEFDSALRAKLSGFPVKDIDATVDYYNEMIDERVDDGMTEAEAVAAVGTPDEIASAILAEIPLPKLIKEKVKPKRSPKAWEIILIVLGAPLWIPLTIAAIVIVLSVYLCIWAVVGSCYCVVFALGMSSLAGIVSGIYSAVCGSLPASLFFFGCSAAVAGAAVFAFLGSVGISKLAVLLGKKILLGIKYLFVEKKEKNA